MFIATLISKYEWMSDLTLLQIENRCPFIRKIACIMVCCLAWTNKKPNWSDQTKIRMITLVNHALVFSVLYVIIPHQSSLKLTTTIGL